MGASLKFRIPKSREHCAKLGKKQYARPETFCCVYKYKEKKVGAAGCGAGDV